MDFAIEILINDTLLINNQEHDQEENYFWI